MSPEGAQLRFAVEFATFLVANSTAKRSWAPSGDMAP